VNPVDRRLGYFLLAASAILLAVNAFLTPAFRVDDSYITFRYSTNLASGKGLLFNAGDPVEGISNPLWAVLLAAFVPLKWNLLETARSLSALAAIGCLYLVFASVRRATGSGLAGGFGALLLASHMGFVLWIYPGLETLFFAFLLTLLIHHILWLAEKPSALWPLVVASTLCLVLPAARPESILVTLAITVPGTVAAFGISRQRALVWPIACTVAGFLYLEFLRYTYYGEWLPNTYYAKVDSGYAALTRMGGLSDVVQNHPAAFLIAAVGLGIFALRTVRGDLSIQRMGPCKRALIATTLGALGANAAFIWTAGQDWMPGWRYFLPVLPALCILAAFGMFQIFKSLRLRLPLRWALTAGTLIAAIGITGQFLIRPPHVTANAYSQEAFAARSEISANELREFISPGNTVAIAAAGIIPYSFPDVQFIDMLGITDRHIAKRGEKFSEFWEKTDVQSVLDRNPEFILIRYAADFGRLTPDLAKECWPALYDHPEFQQKYERVASLEASSLWLYKRVDPPPDPALGHST